MKIVLINSSCYSVEKDIRVESGMPDGLEKLMGNYPPLGICYLASVLRENGFDDIVLIDADVEKNMENVVSRVLKESPDIIGISMLTFSFLYALKLAKKLKEKINVPIVVGGPHVDYYPTEVLTHKCFDIGVIGEGEYVFLEIVKLFNENGKEFYKKLGKIESVVFRRGKKIIRTPDRPLIRNLDEIPFPAIDLLDLKKYHHASLPNPFAPIITSRGCPYRCRFCDRRKLDLIWRIHSPEYVVKEIKNRVYELGIQSFHFYDDTFTVSKDRVLKICKLIEEEKLEISAVCLSRVNLVDKEVIQAMKKAGVKIISFGFESGDDDMLKAMNKWTTVEQAKKAIALCKEVGIQATGGFIIGYPGETRKSILNTIKFIKEAKPDWFKANLFVPYPGSEIYHKLVNEGKIEDFWRKMTIEGKAYEPPNTNENLSIEELRKWVDYINSMVYFRYDSNLFNFHKIREIENIKDLKVNLSWIKRTLIKRFENMFLKI
jgi:radical SAM superfamily enzyme YgiQ (UPF0313 family)